MEIVSDSKVVLQEIYKLLDDKSYSLVVNIPMDTIAEKLKMPKEHLNLCIHYLIECGYLKGDFCYSNEKSDKEVYILPLAINKIECASI